MSDFGDECRFRYPARVPDFYELLKDEDPRAIKRFAEIMDYRDRAIEDHLDLRPCAAATGDPTVGETYVGGSTFDFAGTATDGVEGFIGAGGGISAGYVGPEIRSWGTTTSLWAYNDGVFAPSSWPITTTITFHGLWEANSNGGRHIRIRAVDYNSGSPIDYYLAEATNLATDVAFPYAQGQTCGPATIYLPTGDWTIKFDYYQDSGSDIELAGYIQFQDINTLAVVLP